MMRYFRLMIVLAVAFMAATQAGAEPARLQLVMFERGGCPYCARWDREVAPIYPKTDVGQLVPFRRFSLDQGQPRDIAIEKPVRYTPTFVLLADNQEIGRITGYQDDASFWGLLEAMVERHNKAQ